MFLCNVPLSTGSNIVNNNDAGFLCAQFIIFVLKEKFKVHCCCSDYRIVIVVVVVVVVVVFVVGIVVVVGVVAAVIKYLLIQ